MLKKDAMTTGVAKKFACYPRTTRAVSAREYAVLAGIGVVAIFVMYETFRDDIGKAITVFGRQLSGANEGGEGRGPRNAVKGLRRAVSRL